MCIRFTTKGEILYAFVLGTHQTDSLTIKTLTRGRSEFPKPVARVELVGQEGAIAFVQDERGLTIRLPQRSPSDYPFCFRIR